MNFGENETDRSDSSPHLRQPSYSLIDRFIRLRTTYWNRQYAIILLAYIVIYVKCRMSNKFNL
ncbi:vesicular glutamate transporter 2-like [Aphis craccivora]|uniref:Vesicular glutamate transporter 2-like n=1 Tax=Aphis craccivora TaxID=307492 RepID=A0A6G0Z6F4_APHCR|nr:vesicular glutamate transporter 2-like [Aphis craccivora]